MTRSSVPVERMVSLPATGEPCQYLEWDSTFFGHRIARATHGRLSPEIAAEVERWCVSHRIDCVCLLARSDDFATVRTAASYGFYLVDVRVTLEVDAQNALPEIRPEGVVRPWTLSDVPSLREIARRSHHGTRFYADERFDAARCDELYAEWIERSCRGDADAVFVTELDHGVAGYLSCHAPESKVGQIGLAAVTGGGPGTWSRIPDARPRAAVVREARGRCCQCRDAGRQQRRPALLSAARVHRPVTRPVVSPLARSFDPGRRTMTEYRIPFNRVSLLGHESAYVEQALGHGHLAGDGPFSVRCQALLEEILGVEKALPHDIGDARARDGGTPSGHCAR